jgi:hypothetical protein
MKNSIENMWKEGFLNEKSLIAPQINDLYNQKSLDLIDRMKRMFRTNLIAIVVMSFVILVTHYFLDAVWQGVAAAVLLLLTAWYSQHQMQSLSDLDHGANSLDYLKSFDQWLKNALSNNQKVVRFSYPVYFLIASSTIWSAWVQQPELGLRLQQAFPAITFVAGVPWLALVAMGAITLLMFYFSDKIYRWDVRLVYGRVFNKLEETIAEMEQLK